MYEVLNVTIEGVSPLLMHNGQTANPLNRFSKMMKEVSGKRNKTEADHREMARIEFVAGLYMNENGPVIPASIMEAAIIEGARKSKLGKQAQAAIVVEENARLDYEGPRTAENLFADEAFRLTTPVRIGQQKVVRTRPVFSEWSAMVRIGHMTDILNRHDLVLALANAGRLCGIGDWRPRYGRFTVKESAEQG